MTHARPPHRRALLAIAGSAIAVLAVAAVAGAGVMTGPQPPAAQASNHLCGTSHDALDSQELEFLGHFADWRSANNLQLAAMENSGALNAAAAWFAQHIVEDPGWPVSSNAHTDTYGRDWRQRAIDCGYSGTVQGIQMVNYGSGEGIGLLEGSPGTNMSPSEAVYGASIGTFQHQGVTYPSSGAWLSVSGSLPAKCVGVAKYRNASGTGVAWIVVLARWPAGESCPGSTASPPPTATPSASPTLPATATPSPTATVEPTVTPEPTQEPLSPGRYVPALSREVGW